MTTPVPDVTVIVPVYDAMPYLTECLTSLVEQTIGPGRMEVVAVDDGSTDGSSKEIERFASLHPGLFTVLHQPNSGGPAQPCNRALDVATGRYVYFVGADDYLWREALQRLVAEADGYGSDVVAGKMVGANGRYVYPALYAATDHDVPLYDSPLPWTMSNVKLFRRELVEAHGLRFPEDLPVNSDQVFTLEACIRARRISVLADGDYYYATLRTDKGNITYRTRPEVNLRCASAVMHRAAALLGPGPQRDAILCRHFAWELVKVLTVNFLDLDEATQRDLCRGVAELADAYLTDAIRGRLSARRRVLVSLAQAGRVDLVREVVREQSDPVAPPVLMDGDRVYLRHAGLDADPAIDRRWYELVPGNAWSMVSALLQPLTLGWAGRASKLQLLASLRLPVTGPAAEEPTRFSLRAVPSGPAVQAPPSGKEPAPVLAVARPPHVAPSDDGDATIVRAEIAVVPLLTWGAATWTFALDVDFAGMERTLSLPPGELPPRVVWRGGRAFRISSKASRGGRLQLVVAPIARRDAVHAQARPLVARIRRK